VLRLFLIGRVGAGIGVHAGVGTRAHERDKLERLCRYITRPPVSTKRLSMTRNGRVRYELKTHWRNGTTHVMFESLDFIARLVSLIPSNYFFNYYKVFLYVFPSLIISFRLFS
jgi:hypothetical protein